MKCFYNVALAVLVTLVLQATSYAGCNGEGRTTFHEVQSVSLTEEWSTIAFTDRDLDHGPPDCVIVRVEGYSRVNNNALYLRAGLAAGFAGEGPDQFAAPGQDEGVLVQAVKAGREMIKTSFSRTFYFTGISAEQFEIYVQAKEGRSGGSISIKDLFVSIFAAREVVLD